MNSPPAYPLAERGIVENVRGFMVYGDYRDDHPLSEIVHAVAAGDVAAVWGPVAVYFGAKEKPRLVVASIAGNPGACLKGLAPNRDATPSPLVTPQQR